MSLGHAASPYRAEAVAPDAARDELLRLWTDNLEMVADAPRKFAWAYRDAPEPTPAVFLLRAEDAARPIGTAGATFRGVRVGPARVRAALLADLAVDRAHRTVAPALTLVRAVREWALQRCELAYGFPNRRAAGVFRRAGYATLGVPGRWAKVLRHAAYVARAEAPLPPRARRWLSSPPVAGWVGAAADVAALAAGAPAAMAAARRWRLRWHAGAPGQPGWAPRAAWLDALWAAARGDHGVVAERTAQVLRWRFATAAAALVTVEGRGDGEPGAYAVVEPDADGVAHLRDVFGHRAAVAGLLDLLGPALTLRGARAMSVRYLGAPWLPRLLEARGWLARAPGRAVVVSARPGLDGPLARALAEPARWHLTDLDEDG